MRFKKVADDKIDAFFDFIESQEVHQKKKIIQSTCHSPFFSYKNNYDEIFKQLSEKEDAERIQKEKEEEERTGWV